MSKSMGLYISVLLSVLLILGGCTGQDKPESSGISEIPANDVSTTDQSSEEQSIRQQSEESETDISEESSRDRENTKEIPQTGFTKAVPQSYLAEAEHKGTVQQLDYNSLDYVRDGSAITKTAFVYLPYGYDEADKEKRYDIVYLMHGLGGHSGEYFDYPGTKNVFDNLIANGDIPPVIIVSATFYNEKSERDFTSSTSEVKQFHKDFEDNLMPTVESRYHTYAKDITPEGLKAARDHRIFGGFSLGSVTTWLELCYDYDYIRCYLPMSASCWYYGDFNDIQLKKNDDYIEQLVKDKKLDEKGYFIYHAVGTEDGMKSQSIDMANDLLSRDIFTPGHYVFYQKEGGLHDLNAVQEYLYNALPVFFDVQDE